MSEETHHLCLAVEGVEHGLCQVRALTQQRLLPFRYGDSLYLEYLAHLCYLGVA